VSARRLDRLIWAIAVVALLCDVGIAFTTVLTGAPYVPQWPQFALFPVIFLTFGFAVFTGRSDIREALSSLPMWARVAFYALVIAAAVGFLTALSHLPGQPEQHGSRYFLDDHGHLIPVSHARYERGLVYQQRIFTLIPSVFFAVVAIALRLPRQRARPDVAAS
jgi:hypothetical protein